MVQERFLLLVIVLLFSRAFLYFIDINRFQNFIKSYEFEFNKPAIEKEWDGSQAKKDLLFKQKVELHLNQVYYHNLARFIVEKIRSDRTPFEGVKGIYIPSNFYTPDYIRYSGGSTPWKGHAYYFPMYLTFYLQEMGLNVSCFVKKEDYQKRFIGRA